MTLHKSVLIKILGLPLEGPYKSFGPIGVALASGSKPSAPSQLGGPRHIIPPKQLAALTVSPEETEPGPDAPLLPPPAANLDIA
jgi:hypothetical protein